MHFSISISPEEYLKYYSGVASTVRVRTNEGMVIDFPANAMKPYISHQGISGHFEIAFDSDNRLKWLKKLTG